MPEPIRCAECGEPTHTPWDSDAWQVCRVVTNVYPDGTCTTVTPFAAVACSAVCAEKVVSREAHPSCHITGCTESSGDTPCGAKGCPRGE